MGTPTSCIAMHSARSSITSLSGPHRPEAVVRACWKCPRAGQLSTTAGSAFGEAGGGPELETGTAEIAGVDAAEVAEVDAAAVAGTDDAMTVGASLAEIAGADATEVPKDWGTGLIAGRGLLGRE